MIVTDEPQPPEGFFERFEPPESTPPPPRETTNGVTLFRAVAGDDDRPEIRLGPDVHRVTDEIAKALRVDPELYKRAGVLAHVIRATDELEVKGMADGTLAGSPIVRPMPLSMLTNRVSKHAQCVRKQKVDAGDDDGGPKFRWQVQAPPAGPVRAVLELGAWPGIRELRGVLEAPAMRVDGSIIQARGYDKATGYLYEPNAAFPPVHDEPSHSDAVLAFARLSEPFAEFPYVTPAHRSAVLAAVLTLLARPAIQGAVPCWIFDASSPRSGKSLQVDVIHIIATGRPASRMTFPTEEPELEKVLSGYAMRGSSTVNFDNIGRKFGGDALDKVITAEDTVDLRVLGATELRTFEWRALIFGSGNNVEFRGDMLPRILSPRLESALENPELLDPRISDLRGWTRMHRVELVTAALTILRAYVVAGRPDMKLARWGGFDAWSRLIPHALAWVGAEDPMKARRGLAGDEDPERVAHAALIVGWERLVKEHGGLAGLTLKQAITVLYPDRRHHDPVGPPDGYDEMREAIESLTYTKPGQTPPTERLGKVMRSLKARPIAGRRLFGSAVANGVLRWRVSLA